MKLKLIMKKKLIFISGKFDAFECFVEQFHGIDIIETQFKDAHINSIQKL